MCRVGEEVVGETGLSFDVRDALESLSSGTRVGSDVVSEPSILLGGKQFLALQQHIPQRFQGRRWRIVYNSDIHGFSRLVLQHNCAAELKRSPCCERPVVLIITVGDEVAQTTIGAYLTNIPQSSNRRYIGTEESFVFCVPQGSSSSSALALFKVPPNVSNRYFMLCEGGTIAVGGGGKGPALLLHEDFTTVSCSTLCPTFGLNESLLLFGLQRGSDLPKGVRMEGGEPVGLVRAIQLWTFGEEYFMPS